MSIKCPKCNSESITSHKQGFGFGKAVVGGLIAGPLGLTAGVINSSKIKITYLNCGNSWSAGSNEKTSGLTQSYNKDQLKTSASVLALISGLIGSLFLYWSISFYEQDNSFFGFICAAISFISFAFTVLMVVPMFLETKTAITYESVNIDHLLNNYKKVMDPIFLKKIEKAKKEGQVNYDINTVVYNNLKSKLSKNN